MTHPDLLAGHLSALVQVPSITGDERAVLERLGELADDLGLPAELVTHDLEALRAHPGHPGEEAPRDALHGLEIAVPGRGRGRVCLNGHIDVVGPGKAPWSRSPWSGEIADGFVHGRGSADMKGGVVAALHALAALAAGSGPACEVVLQAVASEEDGGLGTFAALERDSAFDFCLIPEPTAFSIACVQGGALTFTGVVPGRSAHAAVRLEGESAIDRYLPVHVALAEHERRINADVEHPLMAALELPYPLLVGRVQAGSWSSQVPDRLEFEGRVGVRVGETVQEARAALEDVVRRACPDAEVAWTGGQFAPGATDTDDPWIRRLREVAGDAPLVGVPYGSDMRLFCERGIPCAMYGSGGLELAHAVDECVRVDELVRVAGVIERVLASGPSTSRP